MLYIVMSPYKPTAFRVDPELLDGLRVVKDRDGIPVSEQVRRALRAWLESKGVTIEKTKADRKRVGARKRP